MQQTPVKVTRLSHVPNDEQMRDLAVRLVEHLAEPLAERSPAAVCAAFGWRYTVEPIGSPNSTVQSVLVPMRDGGFSVVVNAHHSCSNLEALALVGHEIGHSFFYSARQPPRRIIPGSPEEEQFCDRFAEQLLSGLPSEEHVQFA